MIQPPSSGPITGATSVVMAQMPVAVVSEVSSISGMWPWCTVVTSASIGAMPLASARGSFSFESPDDPGANRFSRYKNPEFDKLLTEAEGTLDVDKRRAIMEKIEIIMQQDGPIVQPFWRTTSTVMDKRIKGFQQHPSQYSFANEMAITA